jgi:hypothetical protein
MKRCSYCGREHSDNAVVCAVDQQPLIDELPTEIPAASPARPRVEFFNVYVISPLLAAGNYRVYLRGSDLLFIHAEGRESRLNKLVAHFAGPLGIFGVLAAAVIAALIWLHSKLNRQETLPRPDEGPEGLLDAHEKNFKLYLQEIQEAVVEGPSFVTSAGKGGQLNFRLRNGKKLKLGFAEADELKAALTLLGPLIQSILRFNVKSSAPGRWFRRKQDELPISRTSHA